MAKILLNIPGNDGEQSKKDKNPDKENVPLINNTIQRENKTNTTTERTQVKQPAVQKTTSEAQPAKSVEDDFAVFPDWDVVPPNAIINPRMKKKA